MRRRTPLIASLLGLLALSGCQLTLTAFLVPASVQVGKVFDVVVQADFTSDPGLAGCVLQLPVGFQIVGHAGPGSITRDDPALLGLYTAEPGQQLACWSAGNQTPLSTATLKVFVRAPAGATTGTIKVALAAQPASGQPFVANSPLGIFDFAQITTATNVRSVAVLVDPPVPFVADGAGLPAPGGSTTLTEIPTAIHVGDWNGDGDDDLIAASYGGIRTWRRAAATWLPATGLPGVPQSTRLASGDFDGDGWLDIAVGSGAIWFGDGSGGWTAGPSLPLTGAVLGVAVGDVDGDGRDDVAFAGYYRQYLTVLLGNADRTFTEARSGLPDTTLPVTVQQPLLRDVTGDGFVDLVGAEVWAGDGQGHWTAGTGIANGNWGAAAADLDGDGLPEILCANPNMPGALVYRHLGNNQWALVPNTGLPTAALRSVAVDDFDRDGANDVVVGFHDGGIELWRNFGGMNFQQVPDCGLPAIAGGVVDLSMGDVNGDTFPDVVAAVSGEGFFVWQNWLGGPSPFGTGCPGTLPTPVSVQTNSAPTLGNGGFAVELADGPPGTLGFVWLGASKRQWAGAPLLPLALDPLGAPGCTLWTGQDAVAWGLFDAQGELAYPLPIPNQPALLRWTMFAQGAAHAPGSNALDLAFTAGLAIRLL